MDSILSGISPRLNLTSILFIGVSQSSGERRSDAHVHDERRDIFDKRALPDDYIRRVSSTYSHDFCYTTKVMLTCGVLLGIQGVSNCGV